MSPPSFCCLCEASARKTRGLCIPEQDVAPHTPADGGTLDIPQKHPKGLEARDMGVREGRGR